MRSRLKCAIFSKSRKSSKTTGPRGPTVSEFWLSPTGTFRAPYGRGQNLFAASAGGSTGTGSGARRRGGAKGLRRRVDLRWGNSDDRAVLFAGATDIFVAAVSAGAGHSGGRDYAG